MKSSFVYLKEWQKALQIEINYLKKNGSNIYHAYNGKLVSADKDYVYYFETNVTLSIPVGSVVRLEWGSSFIEGRMLAIEDSSFILSLDVNIGDEISEAYLYYDPWELLDELIQRLEDIKKSKRKRKRIKQLMQPTMPAKHPVDKIKNSTHELLLRSKYNPVTYVWGPPGTGKTYTLARVAANHYFKNKKVLLLSHSNQAVNVLLQEVYTFINKKKRFKKGEMVRYGSAQSAFHEQFYFLMTDGLIEENYPNLVQEKQSLLLEKRGVTQDIQQSFSRRDSKQMLSIESKLSSVLEKLRQKEVDVLQDAKIVATTLSKAAKDPNIYEQSFDVVMVDEASMAYIPQIGFAASLAKNIIVCGDFMQLPPIAASKHALVTEVLRQDIFHCAEVVIKEDNRSLHPHLFLLNEQRRMHPDISRFTNKYIYQSLVKDHPAVKESRAAITNLAPFSSRANVLLDTSNTGAFAQTEKHSKSRFNIWHLLLSLQLIIEAYESGQRSIGYVTPYRAQALMMDILLDDLLPEEKKEATILSATVHRLQGSERDCIIFDSVDQAPFTRPGMLLIGENSKRLINVAITRSRGKFIHVADKQFISQHVYHSKTLRQLVDSQKETVTQQQIGSWIHHQNKKMVWMHAKKHEVVLKDIKRAKRSITISYPNEKALPAEWINALKQLDKTVIIETFQQTEQNFAHALDKTCSYPFVIIDHKIIWMGMPFSELPNTKPPYISVRLFSAPFIAHFLKQF